MASLYGLEHHGLTNLRRVYWNLPAAALYEEAIHRSEGQLSRRGPFVVNTASTPPAPPPTSSWCASRRRRSGLVGPVQPALQPGELQRAARAPLRVPAGPRRLRPGRLRRGRPRPPARRPHRHPEGVAQPLRPDDVPEEPTVEEARRHVPDFTIIAAPGFQASPMADGTRTRDVHRPQLPPEARDHRRHAATPARSRRPSSPSSTTCCRSRACSRCTARRTWARAATPPSSSASRAPGRRRSRADPARRLVGDDEHGWGPTGVFNFEDGCYAKVIRLSADAEPQIFATTRRFGTILENVVYDPVSRLLDLNDEKLTENTRGAYPLDFIENAVPDKRAGHPKNVVFLTCDASGVMPPISRLSPEQAIYHFISGYTSKIAGTEIGLGIEPEMTFSACFGGPFMVHHPYVYADLLRKKMLQHGATCWLVNTGWTGGPFGDRQAHQHRPHAQAPERGALRGARRRSATARTRSSASTCRRAARASRPRSSSPPTRGAAARSTSRSTTPSPPASSRTSR